MDSAVGECGGCRQHEPAFHAARSFGLYTGKLRQVVLRLKFSGDTRLGERLGMLLAPTWYALPRLGDSGSPLIVPVPLHPSRRRERGFNQSDLLAKGLVRELAEQHGAALPEVAGSCLHRQRATPPQTGLSVAARRENLRGAFEVFQPEAVRARAVVLIDDVMTTGATLSACARALRRAGAGRVMGLTLARATPQFPDLARVETDNTVDGLSRDST
jgi:ComF family protein